MSPIINPNLEHELHLPGGDTSPWAPFIERDTHAATQGDTDLDSDSVVRDVDTPRRLICCPVCTAEPYRGGRTNVYSS